MPNSVTPSMPLNTATPRAKRISAPAPLATSVAGEFTWISSRSGGEKNPKLDLIRELGVDLVVANIEENVREHIETLRAWGIPVFVTYPRTVEDGIHLVRELSAITGTAPRGTAIADGLERQLVAARAGQAGRRRACVFCPIWRNPYMTVNADTYIHDMLAVCGGDNVFAGLAKRYPEVSLDDVARVRPEVILLDLRMPELDGVGAIKEIRSGDEKARIIVLTTFDGDEDIYRAIQAGAKGYLLKDAPREALMDCIRRVHAGETCVPVHLAAKLAQRVSGETLSDREIDVLKLMAQGKSNKEIGSALFISEGTVKSHVKAIFAKMNVISRTEAVANATRRGLIRL